MWVIYAFASAIFAGLTAILAKIGLEDTDSTLATAMRTVVVLVFSLILVGATGTLFTIGSITLSTLTFLILSGLCTGASWICYFKALQMAEVYKVVPIDKSGTIISMLLGMVILNETDNIAVKIIGMLLIAAGTFLMVYTGGKSVEKQGKPEKKATLKDRVYNCWWVFAGLSAVFAALTSVLGKIGMENVDSNLGTTIRTAVVLVMAWVIVFWQKKQSKIKQLGVKNLVFIVLSGVATGASWLCYYRALQSGQASVVVPIDKLSIIITVVFGVLILKEKVSRKTWVALGVLTLGTLVLLIRI